MYYYEVTRLFYKWLNRRSQRRSMTWTQFTRRLPDWKLHQVPDCTGPRTLHDESTTRKTKDQRCPACAFSEEPGAVVPHAGICKGALGKHLDFMNLSFQSRQRAHI